MHNTIIVGGGIAGLMAALHLAKRGLQPLLVEAEDRFGGRMHDTEPIVVKHDGQEWCFPAEHGVHGIWSPYHNLLAALASEGIRPALLAAHEETWIFGRDRLVRRAAIGSAIRNSPIPAPFHYLYCFLRPRFLNLLNVRDALALFQVFGGLCAAMAIDPVAEQRALEGMTLADFTAGWSPATRSLFAGLARSGLAAHPEEIPVSGFIAFLRFYTLLRRDAWAFSYLEGTSGQQMIRPLVAAIERHGGVLRTCARATQLSRDAEGWRVRVGNDELSCQSLVLALDAPAAQALLTQSPATAAEAAPMLFSRGRPTAIVRHWLRVKPRRISEAGILSGDFVLDNFFWLDRLQPAYRSWAEATGGSAVECHIYGPPELLEQPDAVLLARARSDIERAFPELRGAALHTHLQRNTATHTLFQIGAPGVHPAIETPWPELYLCGDWIYHPSPSLYLERATVTGIAAANALLGRRGLATWPLLPSPAPEPLAGFMARNLTALRHRMLRKRRERKQMNK